MNTELLDANELESQRTKAAADQANAERTFVEDLRWVMSSPRGRRVMAWLLAFTGVKRSSFNNSGSVTAFNEGQRNVGLAVDAHLTDHCHDQYLTMLTEQRKAKQ